MHLDWPIALTSANILIPIVLGLAVGLLAGLYRIGGGLLLTPLLIVFNVPQTVAAATGSSQQVVVQQTGVIERLAEMTGNNGAVFGVIAVLAALGAGFVAGLIFRIGVGLIFKNDGRVTDHV